jgi:hypothetical protein
VADRDDVSDSATECRRVNTAAELAVKKLIWLVLHEMECVQQK